MNKILRKEILNKFCWPDYWQQLKIEILAIEYDIAPSVVKKIVESDDEIILRKDKAWGFLISLMKELFGNTEIANRFNISIEQLNEVLKEG